ncbi:hypothetical protein [Pseudomonas sp. ICMP 561]|uniref:hypothetical protein n=1 Tax=Pseudomonas sp. ICMP 561 TaxID=1718918 RepID=UPI000C072B1D|nr:hypothetical protein [Pseudomonas sp. ICMP 561]PHN31861.1 hypothetical protein AO242_13935 [Pseudomonas sp. ICMP 561]
MLRILLARFIVAQFTKRGSSCNQLSISVQSIKEMDDIELIRLRKSYAGELSFEGKETNLAFKVIAFRPVDEEGLSIPGLTVEIHLRVGLTADRCKYTFTLFRLSRQKKRRIYQLEVVPKAKRSHNGPPRLFGPHEHLGESRILPVQSDMDCTNYVGWLEFFALE